jgi:IPT/TIG domain
MKSRLIISFKKVLFFVATFFATNLLAQPIITSFTPLSAKPGDAVTLIGTGFNTTAANNEAFCGATRATVTETSVRLIVPKGSTYDYISLLNTSSGLIANSSFKFTSSFSPTTTGIGLKTFLNRQDFVTGTTPGSTANGDLDGKPDLIFVNVYNIVLTLCNTSTIDNISLAAKVILQPSIGLIYFTTVMA